MPGKKYKSIKNPNAYESIKQDLVDKAKKPISKARMQRIKSKAARISNSTARRKKNGKKK